jgi:hypothetical protein
MRPKKSIALVESKDGIYWREPVIFLEYNESSGWENDLNRPVVVKRDDEYQMWYTGQIWRPDRSCIGYVTSDEGIRWTRKSERPVPDETSWDYFCLENVAYHGRTVTVLYDKHGSRYGKGKGYRIEVDGNEIMHAASIQPTLFRL